MTTSCALVARLTARSTHAMRKPIAVYAAAAYHRMQESAVEVAGTRVAAVTQQLADNIGGSVTRLAA